MTITKTVLMEAVVAIGVALGVGVGVCEEEVGVGVCEEGVGVRVCEETRAVKLIASRYNAPCLLVRLSKATPLMCVAFALRSDKGIVYTFQFPCTGLPP